MYFRIMNLYNCPLALNEIGVKQEPCSIRSQQRPLFRCFPYIYNSANYGRVAPAMSGTLYAALSDLCAMATAKIVAEWSGFGGVTPQTRLFDFCGVSLTPQKGIFAFRGVTLRNGFFLSFVE